ncbi:MAG: hypothetical protein WDN49_09665 [Acetobacteraceae bacterium]
MPESPCFPPNARPVEIVAFPAVQLLDVAGPLQVFASANDLALEVGRAAPYAPRVVAPGEATVASPGWAFLLDRCPNRRRRSIP